MKSQELRFTETNSADDSQGKTWGLDGNLFWYIAGGSFVSVITLLLLFSALRTCFVLARASRADTMSIASTSGLAAQASGRNLRGNRLILWNHAMFEDSPNG